MRASKDEEWKKRWKILNYRSCWALCLLSKESSLDTYCWISFLWHAWKDKTVEMHKRLVVAMEQAWRGADWRRKHKGSSVMADSVTVVLLAPQIWTLGNVHSHTERWIHNSHRQRWGVGEGDECMQRRCKPNESCCLLEPLAMEGTVIRGSRVKDQRTRLFLLFSVNLQLFQLSKHL